MNAIMTGSSSSDVPPNELVLSAPGKVILHGEHAVVHGKRGVAMSLDLRTKLTLTRSNDTVTLDMPDVKIRECWSIAAVQRLYNLLGISNRRQPCLTLTELKPLTPMDAKIIKEFLCISDESQCQRTLALLSFFHLYTSLLPQVEGFTIRVSSQIPTSAGLGSSAAYAACLSGALLLLCGRVSPDALRENAPPSLRRPAITLANACTYASEVIMHGTPSGIDNTACSFGGVISFKDGEINTLGSCDLQILLVNTKVPRSTHALVGMVRRKLEQYPDIINPVLDAMDSLAEKALDILRQLSELQNEEASSDAPIVGISVPSSLMNAAATASSLQDELGCLMDMNHSLLSALGVSHPSLERVAAVAAEHALHCKLTGAGGGGFAMVLVPRGRKPDAFKQCMEALQSKGCQVWIVELGVSGLCLH